MTSIPEETCRAWADVDLQALVANALTVARVAGARLLPMVKAGGYGIGAVAAARALEAVDPWGFGVATIEEGRELRRAGIARPIVVFSPLQPQEAEPCLRHDLRPVIGDSQGLAAWTSLTDRPFHIECDTGMSRSGFRWNGDNAWRVPAAAHPGFEGLFTHFHSADDDQAEVHRQWRRFQAILESLPERPPLVHAANSAAALRGPAFAADMVRPGIFLYGGEAAGQAPRPVVRLQAPVVAVRTVRAGETVSYGATWRAPRDARVATLAIGYADGILRSLGNHAQVEVQGRLCPVVGRVTMDFTMIQVDEETPPGTVATIFGGMMSLDEQARRGGTISYELLTAMGPRVLRRYS